MKTLTTLVTGLSLLVGCAGPPPTSDAELTAESGFTAREGFHALPAVGGVNVSVAAAGGTAFVGDNLDRIRVVDLATMGVERTLGPVPAERLVASGSTLAACGARDDGPVFGPADRHYVITLFDAASRQKTREVRLRLEGLFDQLEALFDSPSMACALDATAGTLSVGFSQDDLGDRFVTFPIPPADVTWSFDQIPGATVRTLDARVGNVIKGFDDGPEGLTFAAGGYGLRRLAPNATSLVTLRSEAREHLVDVAARGDTLFVADHAAGVLVLDAADGALRDRIDLADFVEGVAAADGHLLAVTRQGLYVSRDRWSR